VTSNEMRNRSRSDRFDECRSHTRRRLGRDSHSILSASRDIDDSSEKASKVLLVVVDDVELDVVEL
jgi:hypothetical protein